MSPATAARLNLLRDALLKNEETARRLAATCAADAHRLELAVKGNFSESEAIKVVLEIDQRWLQESVRERT